ncbi:MAG: hypothetical protein ACPGOY_02200 [Rhodospirillaceae bacterium]
MRALAIIVWRNSFVRSTRGLFWRCAISGDFGSRSFGKTGRSRRL